MKIVKNVYKDERYDLVLATTDCMLPQVGPYPGTDCPPTYLIRGMGGWVAKLQLQKWLLPK